MTKRRRISAKGESFASDAQSYAIFAIVVVLPKPAGAATSNFFVDLTFVCFSGKNVVERVEWNLDGLTWLWKIHLN